MSDSVKTRISNEELISIVKKMYAYLNTDVNDVGKCPADLLIELGEVKPVSNCMLDRKFYTVLTNRTQQQYEFKKLVTITGGENPRKPTVFMHIILEAATECFPLRESEQDSTKDTSNEFPRLSECEAYIRRTLANRKLSERDQHIIGTLWAYIEQKIIK